jgi:hypothetical protein
LAGVEAASKVTGPRWADALAAVQPFGAFVALVVWFSGLLQLVTAAEGGTLASQQQRQQQQQALYWQ